MRIKEPRTIITTWVKCVLLFIILILMVVLLSSCEDNNAPTYSKKDEISADKKDIKNKTQKDSSDKSNQGDVEIYAGPGTDFYCEGKIGLSDIKKVVLIDHDWVEVIYKDSQHGYVRKDTIKEIDISGAPILANSIPATVGENKYLQRVDISYRLSGDIDLVEDMETLQKTSFVEKGNLITVVVPFLVKENKYQVIGGIENELAYWLIEANTDRGKERAYVGTRDLFDLDNPLKDFSSVKENNLKLGFGNETFYSSSDDVYYNDFWETISEFDISRTEVNLLDGFWKVVSSTDISLEDIDADPHSNVVSGSRLKLPTLSKGKRTYTNTYTAIGEEAVMAADAYSAAIWLAQKIITWGIESKQTQSFHVLLQKYKEENRMVIFTGSPIESVQSGKYYGKDFSLLELLLDNGYTYYSAIDKVDNTIRGLDPSFNGEKKYSMNIKFARQGKNDLPYGMRIIIDKEGNAFGNLILHQGTKFTICYDNKEIKDITPDIKSYLFQLDKKTSDLLLNLLEESGFEIIKREAVQAEEEHPEATNTYVNNEYMNTITALLSKYGSLRIVQGNGEWQNEANGLCYLNLIDFTGDGNDELFAVCKNDDEDHYTGYIYTLNNGKAELIYENPQIEYNTAYEYDIVYMGYTKDTGFIFGTGWDAPDIDDRTFYWYKDGDFEPVYRSKGYYDDGLEEAVIEEELKIVDIFDDEHIDELWNSFPRVTLRTMGEDDENGNYFGLSELQKSIDDVIRRLDVTPAELPPEVILPGMDVIADAEIYFCLENEIDQWEPSIENDEYFWSVIGNYGLSEPRIDDLNPIVTGDIGDAFILDKSIIENAAYACFSDFSGSLPQFRSYPDMWLVREVGEQTVTLGYGELGVMTERKNYEVNKDKSLDVIYTASYFQDEIEPIADYSVHLVENPNYDKENEFFTYYYTVTNIEKIKDYTETPATADEEAENDGVDPAITDISQVIDMNLTAAEAAHELGLNYEVEDDSEYYFYADSSCDESQGMLWCYGYQYDQNNNWKYQPGDSGISVYGLKNEMSEEELSSIVNKTHFIDVADYFGGDENDKFYYDTNQNEFVIAGKVQNGAVTDLTVFSAIDY